MGWVDNGLAGAGTGAALGPWGAAAGFTVGALSGLIGAGQKKQGNNLVNRPYPNMPIPQEVLDNQTRVKAQSERGLPSEQYQNAMKNIQRSSNKAIKMSADRRGGLALIPTIQQGANDATLNLDTADAKQKLQNQNQLTDVNNQVAGWKNRQWDWNNKQKWQNDYNYGMQLIGAGNANQGNALDTALSTALLLGKVGGFGKTKTTPAATPQLPQTINTPRNTSFSVPTTISGNNPSMSAAFAGQPTIGNYGTYTTPRTPISIGQPPAVLQDRNASYYKWLQGI